MVHKFDNYIRILMAMLLIPVLSIGYLLYNANAQIKDTKADYDRIEKSLNHLEWSSIEGIIYDNVGTARVQSNRVADNIKSQLLDAYKGNENELKLDLANHNSNSPAYTIINNCITDVYMNTHNEDNRIIVADKNQIIADRGYIASNKTKRDWGTEINSKTNKVLAKNSLQMILNHSNRLCYWESDRYTAPALQIVKPDMNSLKEEYLKNGISAMKNYDILVAAYITRDGDIFGIPDINAEGIRNTNDKLIVIQEFNIYDAINSHQNMIYSYNHARTTLHSMMDENITDIINDTVISIIIMILSLIGLLAMVIYCVRQRDDAHDGDH